MKKFLLFLFIGTLMTSCITGSLLTEEIISQSGTYTFDNSYDEVWDAVKGVLATEGYELAFEKKEKGIINTGQKLIRAAAQGNSYTVQSTGFYRQYLVRITKVSDSQTKVVLTPKIYQGNNDISERKIWVLEGQNGEIELWKKFFKKVQELL